MAGLTLSEYITANPDATLAEVQEYSEVGGSLLSIPRMRLYLNDAGLFLIFYDIANGVYDVNGVAHAAKAYCKLVVSTLDGNSTDDEDFNFIESTETGKAVIAMTEYMRDRLLTDYADEIQVLLDKCIAKCNTTIYPYAGTTLIQYNQVKGIYTYIKVENYAGQDIKVTLDSEYDFSITTWDKTEFGYENFGKVGHIKAGTSLTKITTNNKKATGTLYVRIPFENADFTVEIV